MSTVPRSKRRGRPPSPIPKKVRLAETQRRYREANKEKVADGSVPILRKLERRDCPDFYVCLDKAALKNLRQVPCHDCPLGGEENERLRHDLAGAGA